MGARTTFIHEPIAIVVETVVAVFLARPNFSDASPPRAVDACLNTLGTCANVAGARRTAETPLHASFTALATFINQPIAIVVNSVADFFPSRVNGRTKIG